MYLFYGSCPIKYFKERVKTGKLTFLYSERWFKRGWVNMFSPRLIKQMLFYHLHCHRNRYIYWEQEAMRLMISIKCWLFVV